MKQVAIQRFDNTTVTTIIADNGASGIETVDGIQTTVWDKELWLRETLEIAEVIPSPFYLSDLRRRCGVLPPNQNCWGPVATKMLRSKRFRRTGNYRRSPISSRKGGLDWEYERIL